MAPKNADAVGIDIAFHAPKLTGINGGLKGAARASGLKEAWQSAMIRFEVWDDSGAVVEEFKLARRNCSHKELQSYVGRLANPFTIDYLQETTSGDIVPLDEVAAKCDPKPSMYRIVPKVEREVDDAGMSDNYEGSLALLLEKVPRRSDNGEHLLTAHDLREWLMFGIQEEDLDVQRAIASVEEGLAEIDALAKKLADVPFMKLFDDKGKELIGDKADTEREVQYQKFLEDKEDLEAALEDTKHEAQEVIARRDQTEVVLSDADLDPEFINVQIGDVSSWYVSFKSNDRRLLEELAANKRDWDSVKLALGHIVVDPDGHAASDREPMPPWAGRGGVPDGSKVYYPDYTQYKINMSAVTVRRVQHGFGIFKSMAVEGMPFYGSDFEYYHGRFYAGEKHGAGVEYSDNGVYSGQYEHGQKRGQGRFDFTNGDSYQGDFGFGSSDIEQSLMPGGNPYAVGVPHGKGVRTFADGSRFHGEFLEGRATGPGRYESAMGEASQGAFVDGELHGPGRVEACNGDVYEGSFERAVYHGKGTLSTAKGARYEGTWEHGLRSGRGVETLADGAEYDGYFLLGKRSGHGVMRYGLVKPEVAAKKKSLADWVARDQKRSVDVAVEAPRDVEPESPPDAPPPEGPKVYKYKYEGNWLMGRTRTKGAHLFGSDAYYYTFSKRHSLYPYLSDLQLRQDRKHAKALHVRQRHLDLDRVLREEIQRKQTKLFRQQRHHAKRAIRHDFKKEFSERDVEGRKELRKSRLDNLVDKGYFSVEHAKHIGTTNKFGRAADVVDEYAEPTEEWIAKNPLSKAVQSDFEELEERRRTMNLQIQFKKAQARITRVDEARAAAEEAP
ncbi:hypothetical protein M885DRAFT_521078 [Pelagophyceae sp. CCMP2097]|nr:hypothetical protein M885DRAFT_521078 [Pelagophyceae sp. CCMP2097]